MEKEEVEKEEVEKEEEEEEEEEEKEKDELTADRVVEVHSTGRLNRGVELSPVIAIDPVPQLDPRVAVTDIRRDPQLDRE